MALVPEGGDAFFVGNADYMFKYVIIVKKSLLHKYMTHVIITRFNLRIWDKDKNNNPVNTEEWLEHRFGLFETYCYPSVKNQTNKDFHWLVLFDNDTPERFKKKIKGYLKEMPQFRPGFFDGNDYNSIFSCVKDEIRRIHKEGRIITTYLDNDDAIREDFVEEVQKEASGLPDNSVISFKHGLQMFTEIGMALPLPYHNNHFLSLVENPEISFNTIYSFSHYHVEEQRHVKLHLIDNKKKPMWMEVVHGRNMINSVWCRIYGLPVGNRDIGCFNTETQLIENWSIARYIGLFMPMLVKRIGKRGLEKIRLL